MEPAKMLRTEFRASMAALEDAALLVGREVQSMIGQALRALDQTSPALCQQVLGRDDDVDARLYRLDEQIHSLMTLQGPITEDLRLLLALLRVSDSLERIGDGCVNVARLGAALAGVGGGSPELMAQVHELGRRAERAVRTGLDAFGHRRIEVDVVDRVEDQIDLLHEGLTARLIDHAGGGRAQTAWAVQMVLATRHLERIGDHAVKIAGEGRFVVTGHRPLPKGMR